MSVARLRAIFSDADTNSPQREKWYILRQRSSASPFPTVVKQIVNSTILVVQLCAVRED